MKRNSVFEGLSCCEPSDIGSDNICISIVLVWVFSRITDVHTPRESVGMSGEVLSIVDNCRAICVITWFFPLVFALLGAQDSARIAASE